MRVKLKKVWKVCRVNDGVYGSALATGGDYVRYRLNQWTKPQVWQTPILYAFRCKFNAIKFAEIHSGYNYRLAIFKAQIPAKDYDRMEWLTRAGSKVKPQPAVVLASKVKLIEKVEEYVNWSKVKHED